MFITNHITELQAIASIIIIVAFCALFFKIIIYAKISKKTKSQGKVATPAEVDSKYTEGGDWQEFSNE